MVPAIKSGWPRSSAALIPMQLGRSRSRST
jgi:hypothetical protein